MLGGRYFLQGGKIKGDLMNIPQNEELINPSELKYMLQLIV